MFPREEDAILVRGVIVDVSMVIHEVRRCLQIMCCWYTLICVPTIGFFFFEVMFTLFLAETVLRHFVDLRGII